MGDLNPHNNGGHMAEGNIETIREFFGKVSTSEFKDLSKDERQELADLIRAQG